jgi:exopolysaccharide production protein ExoQ
MAVIRSLAMGDAKQNSKVGCSGMIQRAGVIVDASPLPTRIAGSRDSVGYRRGGSNQELSLPIAVILVTLAFISFSEISPPLLSGILPEKSQQVLTLMLWIILSIILVLSPGSRSIRTVDTLLIGLFYAFPIFSVLWSDEPLSSLPKCAALAVTTVSAWLCASHISVRAYAICASVGLTLLLLVSLFLVFFVPEIGLMHTWEHAGAWTGLFTQKQSLGIAAAVLATLSLNLLFQTGKMLFVAAIFLSVIMVFGSGSRGGLGVLIIGVFAALCIWRTRSGGIRWLLISVPLFTVGAVTTVLLVLLITGSHTLSIFGLDFDISSRTLLWQHGIQFWQDAPLLGSGLDAFWHNDTYYFSFLRNYGWVLDNFHNGYIEILIETGCMGYILTGGVTFRFARNLRQIARSEFEFSTITGLMIIIYILNVSETFFLRSTAFLQTTFLFLLVKAAQGPDFTCQPRCHLVSRAEVHLAKVGWYQSAAKRATR